MGLLQAQYDSIPFFNTFGMLTSWLPRRSIRFYNVHVHLLNNVYRVGESTLFTDTIYIFDQNGYQWGEYWPNPSYSR